MNSRQRILHTIAGQPVDRPALAPFLHVNFIKEHRRDNSIDPVVETIAVHEEFGFDLIHRNCTPVCDDLTIEGPDWKPEVSETCDGVKTLTTVTVHTPGGQLRRVTQSNRLYEYESSCFLVEPPIKSPADLDLFTRYQPPVPAIDATDIVGAGSWSATRESSRLGFMARSTRLPTCCGEVRFCSIRWMTRVSTAA